MRIYRGKPNSPRKALFVLLLNMAAITFDKFFRESHIYNVNCFFLCTQPDAEIFRLYVPMYETLFMQKLYAFYYLFPDHTHRMHVEFLFRTHIT